jgi:hypothetical protein
VGLTARGCDLRALLDLYERAPRMAPYLMDLLVPQLRARVVATLPAFSPSMPLSFAAELLGFDTLREVSPCAHTTSLLHGLHVVL